MSTYTFLPRRGWVLGIGLVIVLLLGLSSVTAQQLVQTDKRLNQVADFGGDALYCIDAASNPTNDSATFDHFLLLSGNGQPLWTLSRATVEEGLGEIKVNGTPKLLGEGHGTYGEINLYGNANADGSPYFIFTGFDDHYKPNVIVFKGCTPVGSALAASPSGTAPPAQPVIVN